MQTITNFINKYQLAAKAGMIAPIVFVGVFTIEGALRPDYHPFSMYVSALSLGARGWIQIANFIIFGSLLLVFTRGLYAEFSYKTGILLFTIIANCFLLSGVFVMDPMFTPRELMSVPGTIHGILGGIVFTLMPISCFVFLQRFKTNEKWYSFQNWTLSLGSIIALAVVVLTIVTKIPSILERYKDWLGLIQRAAIVPFMLWIFLFASRLNKINCKS